MNHHMNKNMKIWLVLATLVAVASLTIFWAITYVPIPSMRHPGEFRPPEIIPGDIEVYYTVKTIVSTINATLSMLLLIIYIDIYQKTKSEFTIGLIIFSMVFLLNALASNPIMMWGFGFQPFGLGPFAMLPDLFTCVALAVLLYLTLKY